MLTRTTDEHTRFYPIPGEIPSSEFYVNNVQFLQDLQ